MAAEIAVSYSVGCRLRHTPAFEGLLNSSCSRLTPRNNRIYRYAGVTGLERQQSI
jgi:hypothetical protein